MLTTVSMVRMAPGLNRAAQLPTDWLVMLIADADAAIKSFLKRAIELAAFTEYYDGDEHPNVIMKQYPVLCGQTTITAGSNSAVLPTATINVASTENFHQTPVDPDNLPTISLQTGTNPYGQTTVRYTGTTSTSFTGCSGGTGTLATGYAVATPTVWFDPQGNYGQSPSAFGSGTQLTLGAQFAVRLDGGGKTSNRGLLQRTSGYSGGGGIGLGAGFPLSAPYIGGGKLAAGRLPCWPRGASGNIKVAYSAGFAPDKVPKDLQYACTLLVAYMSRTLPTGAPLASESLGAYSYSVMQSSGSIPELGSMLTTLSRYRELSW